MEVWYFVPDPPGVRFIIHSTLLHTSETRRSNGTSLVFPHSEISPTFPFFRLTRPFADLLFESGRIFSEMLTVKLVLKP
jgi:hypothetical protein